MTRETMLLTGGSGFLGRNILPALRERYAVTTCGLDASDDVCHDLSLSAPKFSHRFDVVVHAAGRAHLNPKTHSQRQAFFDVNYQGTINLCRALAKTGIPRSFIFISTVAVYGVESGTDISEDWLLNGTTPYAVSNIQAEQFLTAWCKDRNITLTILRPALMAGADAPGNLGDMVKGIRHGLYANINGGNARKSMLMASDIADLIPLVVDKGGIYNVCDDHHPSYAELSSLIAKQCGRRHVLNIPRWLARFLVAFCRLTGGRPLSVDRYRKLTKTMTFSNKRAKNELGWKPSDVLSNYKINK